MKTKTIIINESQLDVIRRYENEAKINEHKHLSDIADKEFYNIVAEFRDMFKADNYGMRTFENVHGVNIPIKIFDVNGYYSIEPNETVPKMESTKAVCFYVYYLDNETKPIYDKYVNKSSVTNVYGVIKLVVSALDGKLDMLDLNRAISTLPHEQIHGIQQLKSGGKPINKGYSRATVIRHSTKNDLTDAEKLLSQMMWYFDKREIDANIHKFAVEYRDVINRGGFISMCSLPHQIKTMDELINKFKKYNEAEMSECLKLYGQKWNRYLKYCQHLFAYTEKRFAQVKANVENGEYPYPDSKNMWT